MRLFFTITLAALLQSSILLAASPQAPSNLRSCDKVKPVGTDEKPFFGWYFNDPDDNEIQTAYQIIVSVSPDLAEKTALWNSGKTLSRQQNYVMYAGKELQPGTRYYWKVRTWDKDGNVGSWSQASSFDTGLFKAQDWSGAVWIRRDTKDPNDYTYFRKQITVGSKKIKRAVVYLTAFHNYELFINGKPVGKGPGYHYPQYAYYNAYDVTASLTPKTTIAALSHWYGGGQGRAKGERGFLMKLVVEYTDGTKASFGTDKSWRQKAVDAFDPNTKGRNPGEGVGYIDVIDSRKEIFNWHSPEFNDASWQNAVELGAHPTAPFTGELQADLTRLKERKIKPVSVKRLNSGAYLIDFGKVYAGMPEISFEGGRAGDTIKMRGGFVLKEDGTVSEKLTQNTNLSYFFVLNGKKAVFKPFVYMGYRYFQVDNSPMELNSSNVSFTVRYFELEPERARFESSDEMLNRVWELMTHSLTVGAQEGYVDTPTREKGEFLGDAFSQGIAAMLSMGERALSHRVLLEFLDSQDQYWPDGRLNAVYPNNDGKRDIPDFTQQYLIWVWDYYMLSGNLAFLKDNYNKLRKVAAYVDAYKNSSTGLIQNLAGGSGPYKYGIIDWPATMRYGYDMKTASRTVINAYAYMDFSIISRIARILGNDADAKLFARKADSIKTAFNAKFINADGLYIDGLQEDGSQSAHVSQHANMFPLAFGMVPEDNKRKVLDVVKEKKMSAGMVTVRFLTEALAKSGEGGHLLDLYTNPEWDGWAQTISLGGTATWESWDALKENQSMCHPWGASGLAVIQQYILGVKVLEPQHNLIEVKPLHFGGKLSRVSGVVPTDKGNIEAGWSLEGDKFTLKITIPDNVRANVYIPKGSTSSNMINMGAKSVAAEVDGGYLVLKNVGSGSHLFERSLNK